MSKVYVLMVEDCMCNVVALKVFSSYATLVSWLDARFGNTYLKNFDNPSIKSKLVYETLDYKLYCEVHDLIGETSHKTGKLVF